MSRKILLRKTLLLLLLLSLQRLSAQTDIPNDTLTVSRAWILEGINAYEREQYDSSLFWYKKVASQDTNYALALYEMGLSYFKLKKYDESISSVIKADSIDPSDQVRNLLLAGRSWQKKGKIEETRSILYKLKKKYPYNAGLYTEHAHVAMEEKNWALALVQLDSAFRINPTFHTIHLFFSEIAYLSGQPSLAMLAAHFGSLSLSSASDQYQLVQLLNYEADDNFSSNYEVPVGTVGEFPELDEINELVKSKVCYTKNYKLKLKLDEKYIRQLQIIIENLEQTTLGQHDYLSNFYLNYYKTVADFKMFEACILYGLDAIKEAPAVAKLLKSKKSAIEQFAKWHNDELRKLKRENFTALYGFGEDYIFQYFKNGQISLFGKLNENKKADEWTYFHDNGHTQAKGKYDNEVNKIGEWLYYYNTGTLSAKENYTEPGKSYSYELYHQNGNIREKATKVNGQIEGLYSEYHPNGVIKREINVKNGNVTGQFKRYDTYGNVNFEREFKTGSEPNPFKEYYSNNTLEQKGIIVGDKYSGLIEMYYPDGKLKEKAMFENDKRAGWSVKYYRNGQVQDSSFYSGGKINGTSAKYAADGTLSSRLEYKNGKINGLSVWYDENDGKEYARLMFKNERLASYEFLDKQGNVIFSREEKSGAIEWVRHTPYGNATEKGIYNKGEFDGPFEAYHPDGSPSKKCTYKEGKIVGKYLKYFQNGKTELERTYNNEGNIDGWSTEYYRTGTVRSIGYFRNGKREGLFTSYYLSGKVSQENWFENDQIKSSREYNRNGECYLYETYENGDLIQETHFKKDGSLAEIVDLKAGEQMIDLNKKTGYTISKGKFINGGKVGQWTYYLGKNIVSSEINYKNGVAQGVRKNYYSTGKLSAIENYLNGSVDSSATYYNELGQLESEKFYNLGDEEGTEKYYYANGKLQTIYNNYNDELNGKSTMYAPDGTVMIERQYFRGDFVYYEGLNEQGKKVTIPFTNQTGAVKTFYADGKPAVNYTMKNGIREGEYKLYDTNGKVLFAANYENGYLNGKYTDYYPGGVLLEESEYVNGSLHGQQKMYYPNGKVAFIETYFEGQLNGKAEYYNEKGELVRKTEFVFGYEKN